MNLWLRIALFPFFTVGVFEAFYWYVRNQSRADVLRKGIVRYLAGPLAFYHGGRHWLLEEGIPVPFTGLKIFHWMWAVPVAIALLAFVMVWARRGVLWFERHIRSRVLGTRFEREVLKFPFKAFKANDCLDRGRREPDWTFVGKADDGTFLELKPQHRETHIEIIGRTGSGKSRLLEVMMYQDMRSGRGVVFLDGKGDEGMRKRFCGMARMAGRHEEVRVFDLVDAQRSWTYNPAFVAAGRDPIVIAEKLFSIFECDDPFYRQIQESFFTLLILTAHGTGKEFTIRDLHRAVRSNKALGLLRRESSNKQAVADLKEMLESLGSVAGQSLAGLETWLRRYSLIPQLNEYHSERSVDLEEIVRDGGLLYVRLPAGYRQLFAAAVGRLLFQDLQFIAGVRQISDAIVQMPCAIYADEYSVFSHPAAVQALNKARSAHLWWTIAHQSYSDLESVSPEFAEGIWDNTRTKIVLAQRSQKLCQRLADELGTRQVVERTERETRGPLLSRISTADASTKLVDVYELHPNRIKNLYPFGQGYVLGDQIHKNQTFAGVNFGQLDVPECDVSPPAVGETNVGLRLASRCEELREKSEIGGTDERKVA